ncbi:MAG TPA: universal stress protein [Streptosporangiaceae bacterium]|nr:universal stress protein [Streptosporangiaceae bacterium]
MGTIVLGVDAQHYAPDATELTRDLARATGDKIVILHVHEFAVGRFGRLQVDCGEGEAEELVETIKTSLTEAGTDVAVEIRETHVGRVAKAILEAADEHDARFTVLGSSHSTDLPHLPVGSVALRVLHHAKRPVMVVPRGRAVTAQTPVTTAATAG